MTAKRGLAVAAVPAATDDAGRRRSAGAAGAPAGRRALAGNGGVPKLRPGKSWTRGLGALLAAMAVWLGLALGASAAEANVAVAANFSETAKKLAAAFERESGDVVRLSFGSSGQLFAQIAQGAPYGAFLSADQARAERAIAEGFAAPDSRFTYAVGRLALWSREPGVAEGAETLRQGAFDRLALANPAVAPYGAAAVETLKALGVYEALRDKLAMGQSISQAYQFVSSGNAKLGFVALAQLAGETGGSRWIVPETLHAPIRQDAVLLKGSAGLDVAARFLAFLRGPEGRTIIEAYGYGVDAGRP